MNRRNTILKLLLLVLFTSINAQLVPIRWVIEDADRNGKPDRRGQNVTVTGIVTAPDSIFDTRYTDIYIQDTSAGINVFSYTLQNADLGDSVLVNGRVDWYRGKTEISSARVTILAKNRPLPSPRPITCRQLDSEEYEGELVILSGVKISNLFLNGNTNYNIEDTSGTSQVRIDAQTEIPGFICFPDTFTIIGIKGQYTSDTTQPLTGYQLLPRYRSDFSAKAEDLPLLTIEEVQEPGADGATPKLINQWTRVRGRVTGPAKIFSTSTIKSLYIQDATQGINIYNCTYPEAQAPFLDSLGIELGVVGRVIEYNGLTELSGGAMWVTDTIPVPVNPRLLPFNVPLTEAMESNLLTVVGDIISQPVRAGSGYNMVIKNGTPGIAIRIGDNTGIMTGWLTSGRRIRVTGIVGQYDYEEPYNSGYQLLPRLPEDIIDTSAAFPPASKLQIDSVFPNPFAPKEGQVLTLQINSPRTGYNLTVRIYDLKGRMVRELLHRAPGGYYDLKWDGTNDLAQPLPAGIYLLNIQGVNETGNIESLTRPVVIAVRMN